MTEEKKEEKYTLGDYFLDWHNSDDDYETLDKLDEYENEKEFGDVDRYAIVRATAGVYDLALVYTNTGSVPIENGADLDEYILEGIDENSSDEDIDEAAKAIFDPGSPWAKFVTVLWEA